MASCRLSCMASPRRRSGWRSQASRRRFTCTWSTLQCRGEIAARFSAIYALLDNKYYFDRFNDWFFAAGSRWLGNFASTYGDRTIIDGWVVNGSAKLVGLMSRVFRRIQSGYVYHYAFAMIVGVFGLLYWWGVR